MVITDKQLFFFSFKINSRNEASRIVVHFYSTCWQMNITWNLNDIKYFSLTTELLRDIHYLEE